MYHSLVILEPLEHHFVDLLTQEMNSPNAVPLLLFHQLGMLLSLDQLLLFEYLPPSVFNHLHVAVLVIERFFHLLRFNKLFCIVFTHKALSILVILLPNLSQLQITVNIFLRVLTILRSQHLGPFLKFDFRDILHKFCHLLVILHQKG